MVVQVYRTGIRAVIPLRNWNVETQVSVSTASVQGSSSDVSHIRAYGSEEQMPQILTQTTTMGASMGCFGLTGAHHLIKKP